MSSNKSKSKTKRFTVQFSEVEWDVDPQGDEEYDAETVAALPKTGEVTVNAPNVEAAIEWAMSDFSDNHGFCIQGCKTKVERVVV